MTANKHEGEFDERLRNFFLEMATVKGPKSRNCEDVDEFFFHMKDCLENLRQLCALRDKPLLFDQAEANQIMEGVIYHAVPHLIAAARLYDYVPDLFKEDQMQKKRAKKSLREKAEREKVRT